MCVCVCVEGMTVDQTPKYTLTLITKACCRIITYTLFKRDCLNLMCYVSAPALINKRIFEL